MADQRIEDVVIHSAERTRNSTYGNPGFRFHTSEGTFPMQTDASLGYSVENYSNSSRTADDERSPWVIGNPAEPKVTLLATGSRKVYGIEYRGQVLT